MMINLGTIFRIEESDVRGVTCARRPDSIGWIAVDFNGATDNR